jgi:hypothetical protein
MKKFFTVITMACAALLIVIAVDVVIKENSSRSEEIKHRSVK